MRLHEELLAEAKRLAMDDTQTAGQARLRRAVSTAYYALYHLLVYEASSMFVADDEALRALVCRAFVHTEMRTASKPFASKNLPSEIREIWDDDIPDQLQSIATTFRDLQTQRHYADYKLNHESKASAVVGNVRRVEKPFAAGTKSDMSRSLGSISHRFFLARSGSMTKSDRS